MKHLLICWLLMLSVTAASAQDSLTTIRLTPATTLHFLSPEPIKYVDISTKQLVGDLALPNLLRVRLKDSSAVAGGVVTITGEDFIVQYRLLPGNGTGQSPLTVNIQPEDCQPLDISGVGLTQNQLLQLCYRITAAGTHGHRVKVKKFGVEEKLNRVYTFKDYIFLDLSLRNHSRIRYDIDQLRFSIQDKKVTKASNVQSFELKPVYVMDNKAGFDRTYRNVFVFKKMTFPGNKVLHIGLNEKQLSGRVVDMAVPYRDILNADNLPD